MLAQPTVPLRDQAAAYIRQQIASGQVAAGDRLAVRDIADELGMSITPVREALLLLLHEGTAVQEANRVFRVAAINRRDIADAYLVHEFAAGELVARAAERVDDALLAELGSLDAAIRQACEATLVEGHDLRGRIEALNYELHGLIYARAASPRLWAFVEQASHFGPRRFWVTIPGWVELNRDGHQPIIEALRRRDPEASRAAITAHLEQAQRLLVAHLDRAGVGHEPVESHAA